MATRYTHSLLVIFALLAAAGATSLGGRKSLAEEAPAPSPVSDDAFVILNANDGEVVSIGKFAVEEYNNQNKGSLVFESVFAAAYTSTSDGINYGLIIILNDGTQSQPYDANVLLNNGAKKLLGLWKRSDDDDDN